MKTRDATPPPCAHCVHWPRRPLFSGFSAHVDAQPEVSDADISAVYKGYIQAQLAKWSQKLRPLSTGGRPPPPRTHKEDKTRWINEEAIEAAFALRPNEWNLRLQMIDGIAYVVGGAPKLINHHHRKRLRGVGQIVHALLMRQDKGKEGQRSVPNVDLVLNLGDAPRTFPPEDDDEQSSSSLKQRCADFEWSDLALSAHGPFGPIGGHDSSLHENGFCNETTTTTQRDGRMIPPLFSAVACCHTADVSFPTVWYDFDEDEEEDDERGHGVGVDDAVWEAKKEVAYFRGSIFWLERHGRTRAFAKSLAQPDRIDVDWYEQIHTKALEADDVPHFGERLSVDGEAHKYLLSLEGHSFWSFRLRHLMRLHSAILHQDLPCHEFWHALLRPYEHYLPLKRDLSDLLATIDYAKQNDEAVRRMVGRMRRLSKKLLSRDAVLGYVSELLFQYAALQDDGVATRPHPDAVPLERLRPAWEVV